MAARPRIKASFRPLRRGGDAVQLGLRAESGAIVLTGLTTAEMALLERVDGSLSEAQLYASAVADGVDRRRAEDLLTLLRQHGVLSSGPLERELDRADLTGVHQAAPRGSLRLRGRARRHVVVDGPGRLPWAVATLLRSGGVGRVDAGPWAADLLDADLRGGSLSRPDLVVLVAELTVDVRAGDPWLRRGISHLPVVADGERVVVGPLVGPDPLLPCLRCVQFARSDLDAGWPALAAQAVHAPRAARQDPPSHGAPPRTAPAATPAAPFDPPVLAAAAGVVAMLVTANLDGDRIPAGVSVEMAAPWPRLDHRRWMRHPACPAHRDEPGAYRASGGSIGGPVARRVTMTE